MERRFDVKELDAGDRKQLEDVYQKFGNLRSSGGFHESDMRAIIDVWRGLRYLLRPVAVETVVKTKDAYPDLPAGYVSSES